MVKLRRFKSLAANLALDPIYTLQEVRMLRRLAIATSIVTALVAGALFAPTASARTSWSVSIDVPGVAIATGSPVYYRPYYRPYYRAYAPAVVYPAPIAYAEPYPYVYPAPVVVRRAPYYYGPRRVYYRW